MNTTVDIKRARAAESNVVAVRRRARKVPALYETDASKYAGPHRWQTRWYARLARRAWRGHAYTRWITEAFSQITVTGREHLPQVQDGPCIYIGNHTSHLDTLLIHAALPERIRGDLYFGSAQDRWFVKGRKKLVLQPWYQSLALGNFPIMRGGGRQALSYAEELLAGGHSIFLFPEGTRAQGDELGEFKHGVALLALKLGVPVLPIYLEGLQKLRPKGSKHVRRGPAAAHFLSPIAFAAGTATADATATLQAAMNAKHRECLGLGDAADETPTLAPTPTLGTPRAA
ncbi:MAG: lysophospholipid acyltransferase family protein [Pseudomonadota bacterium]